MNCDDDYYQDGIRLPMRNDYTLCGNCMEQVPTDREHPCRIIQSLKRKMDSALHDIQNEFKNRFESLESKITALDNFYADSVDSLNKRIETLEHQIKYIMKEENRLSSNETKVWKGCDDLDSRIEKLETSSEVTKDITFEKEQSIIKILNDYDDRLNKLEQHKNYQIDENREISSRVDEEISSRKELGRYILERIGKPEFKNKIPHKCPVCDGLCGFKNETLLPGEKIGRFRWQDERGVFDKCTACEGKGVIWN